MFRAWFVAVLASVVFVPFAVWAGGALSRLILFVWGV